MAKDLIFPQAVGRKIIAQPKLQESVKVMNDADSQINKVDNQRLCVLLFESIRVN